MWGYVKRKRKTFLKVLRGQSVGRLKVICFDFGLGDFVGSCRGHNFEEKCCRGLKLCAVPISNANETSAKEFQYRGHFTPIYFTLIIASTHRIAFGYVHYNSPFNTLW